MGCFKPDFTKLYWVPKQLTAKCIKDDRPYEILDGSVVVILSANEHDFEKIQLQLIEGSKILTLELEKENFESEFHKLFRALPD